MPENGWGELIRTKNIILKSIIHRHKADLEGLPDAYQQILQYILWQ